MLSIMIVDDERGVIELIKNLIDYDLVEVTIVGEVQNGVDAYNMILEKKPDFVITDIRMPGLTGLELIEKVKAVRPETAFAVISGYRDFEYAQARPEIWGNRLSA